MELKRVLRNTPISLTHVFYDGSTAVNADAGVTVVVKKADGTSLVSGSASGPVSNVYTYTGVTPQANLHIFTVTWTGTFSGVSRSETTYLEVAGDYYFSIKELRDYDTSISPSRFDDAALEKARLGVETEFEDIVSPRAFVARFWREPAVSIGDGQLILDRPEPIAVTKLVVDGVDKLSWVSAGYVTSDRDDPFVLNLSGSALAALYATTIEIEYEFGMRMVPVKIKQKALKRAKMDLLGSANAIDERALTLNVPEFGTMTLATPGQRKSWTGVPDIDATLSRFFLASASGDGAVY